MRCLLTFLLIASFAGSHKVRGFRFRSPCGDQKYAQALVECDVRSNLFESENICSHKDAFETMKKCERKVLESCVDPVYHGLLDVPEDMVKALAFRCQHGLNMTCAMAPPEAMACLMQTLKSPRKGPDTLEGQRDLFCSLKVNNTQCFLMSEKVCPANKPDVMETYWRMVYPPDCVLPTAASTSSSVVGSSPSGGTVLAALSALGLLLAVL